jgi:hypothetical protein
VIIVDPRTLQGDAAEAVRLLVREGRCVVVLTSSLLEHEAAQYAQGGVSAFAFKGIPLAALISLIESLIGS